MHELNAKRRGKRPDPALQDQFVALVDTAGFRVSEDSTYRDTKHPLTLLCSAGHAFSITPATVLRRERVRCPRCCPPGSWHNEGVRLAARDRFLTRLADLGGTLAPGADYTNSTTHVDVLCASGHQVRAMPNRLMQGGGLCAQCTGATLAQARDRFLRALTEAGAALAASEAYVNAHTPVTIALPCGHARRSIPREVRRGNSLGCHTCTRRPPAGRSSRGDLLYLLHHRSGQAIKVGITCNRGRIREHERNGYELVALWNRPRSASRVESSVLDWWKQQGWPACRSAPSDGWTETTTEEHLGETLQHIRELAGQELSQTAVTDYHGR